MRNFRIPELLLGSLLTVAVFALGVVFGLRTTAGTEAGGFSWLTHDAAGFFTFGLVIVGGIQALMFLVQLRYMRRSLHDAAAAARAARDAAVAASDQVRLAEAQIEVTKIGIFDLERAYVDVTPDDVLTDFIRYPSPPSGFFQTGVDPLEVRMTLTVKNSGKTRAVITRVYGEFSQELGPSPSYNFLLGNNTLADTSLSAGEVQRLPEVFTTPNITDQFFLGFVEYRDIFGRPHTSRFCMRIFPAQGPRMNGKMQLGGSDKWRAFD